MIGAASLGRHELGEPLGDGPLGQRFRAVHRGCSVVVEATSIRCDDEQFERALRRLELMAELRHPHLVPVLDAGIDRDHLFVVTPAPDPTAIDDHRSTRTALEVIAAAAAALAHLHERGALHRDVQLVHLARYGGVVKLGGLGLCDLRERGTRGVGPIGAISTMAPSIVRGRPATRGSDVYGLGATLHLLATGRAVHPLRAESLASRICRIGSAAPIVDPTLDPAVRDLVVTALTVDGDDRDEVVGPVIDRFVSAAGDAEADPWLAATPGTRPIHPSPRKATT